MTQTRRDKGLAVARAIACGGQARNWRSVETRLHQLGYYDAELWFEDRATRDVIDGLCADHYKSPYQFDDAIPQISGRYFATGMQEAISVARRS